jgi:hypothetical protein
MTETDAISIAALDTQDAFERLGRCSGPSDVLDLVRKFFMHRVRNHRTKVSVRSAFVFDETKPLSTQISLGARRALHLSARTEEPEDARAIALWAVGHPDLGPGFLQSLLAQVPDSGTKEATTQAEQEAVRIREALDSRDVQVFEIALRSLPRPWQRIVRGHLEEARIASVDFDGETARHKIGRARRIVRAVHRRQQERERLGLEWR